MYAKKINSGTVLLDGVDIEENIYSSQARDQLTEEGALSDEEAGFMQGYDESGPAEKDFLEEEEVEEDDWESWDDYGRHQSQGGVF